MNIKGMSYTNERHLRCQKVADAACSDAAFFGSKRYGVCRICQLGTCRATVTRRDAVGRNHRPVILQQAPVSLLALLNRTE